MEGSHPEGRSVLIQHSTQLVGMMSQLAASSLYVTSADA